ncbi:MAG: DnaB-like helicase C-terminal domain-containing protein [Flavobacteriales bacterium]|nr:DnaB-like helicase C-terminal domain-containing protein [Flavobacteriales bacterium]
MPRSSTSSRSPRRTKGWRGRSSSWPIRSGSGPASRPRRPASRNAASPRRSGVSVSEATFSASPSVWSGKSPGSPHPPRIINTPASGWSSTGRTTTTDSEIDGNRLFLLEDMTVTHNTAFVLSMARNIAVEQKRAVAVFSLEMSSTQLVTRLIASEAGISSEKLRKGDLNDQEFALLHQHISRLDKAPIFIDDTPALNIFELRAKARRLKSQHNVELIIIDYLQLMTGGTDNKGGNREQEISSISRSIKSIAKELDVPIIALSQLSRAVETRGGDKRPQLSDLRESGAIEQDADLVCFLYRPEYYKIYEDHYGSTLGIGECIIAKHRNGALDTVLLRFIPELAKFADLETTPVAFDAGGTGSDGMRTITRPSRMNDDADEAPF